MAAKTKYTGLKAAIGGGAVAAVILGAGYFSGRPSASTADAASIPAVATSSSASTGFAPAANSAAAPATGSTISGTTNTTTRPNVATAPRVKKSRGS